MKKIDRKNFFVIVITIALCLTGCELFKSNKVSFEVTSYKSQNEWITCPVVEVMSNQNKETDYEYSFDGGETWSDKQTIVACNTSKLNIKVRDAKEKMIYEDSYVIAGIDGEKPTINIDKEYTFNVGDDVELLSLPDVNDNVEVSSIIASEESIDTSSTGVHNITYDACDSSNNCTSITTKIIIKEEGTNDSQSGQGSASVSALKVSEIKFSQPDYSAKVNESIVLGVKLLPENAIDKSVAWTSSDENIATVINGRVYGHKTGKVTITASNDETSSSVIVNVIKNTTITITIPPESISISPTTLKLTKGLKSALTVTILPASATNKTVTYESSNQNIATVSNEGVVTAVSEGSANITATTFNGRQATVKVTVTDTSTISFDKANYSCNVGDKISIMIKASGNDQQPLAIKSYGSNNNNIATITNRNDGLATDCADCAALQINCNKTGSTKLMATNSVGKTVYVPIKVSNVETKITFDKTEYKCKQGTSFYVNAKITSGLNESTISYFASHQTLNTRVAEVVNSKIAIPNCASFANGSIVTDCVNKLQNRSIPVYCNKVGITTLEVTTTDGVTSRVKVEVEPNESADSINFSQPNYNCEVGDKLYTMIETYGGGTIKSVTSSANAIATITDRDDGKTVDCANCQAKQINCKTPGISSLAATSSTGKTVSIVVRVTPKNEKIAFDKTGYSCKKGEKLDVKISASATNGAATISSYKVGNQSIATIASHPTMAINCVGCAMTQVTCNTVGETTITAMTVGGARAVVPLVVKDY